MKRINAGLLRESQTVHTTQGALKTRNWTSRNLTTRHHIARVDNAELDNTAPYSKGGQRET